MTVYMIEYLAPAILLLAIVISAVRILREYERGVIFFLGRFQKVKGPGLIIVIPVIQQMERVDLRVIVMDVPTQDVISKDNVSVKVNAVVYFRIVDPEKAPTLLAKLQRGREAVTDPETGTRPVARVYSRVRLYTGEMTPMMAELLVGYTPGYCNSSQSFMGATGSEIINLNPWAWSGDHSMAFQMVPGSLFSSRPVAKAGPTILDLPVTILEHFGIAKPPQMVGTSIFST